jgi:adenosylcobinamide-GDP ribazoletransferase
MSVAMSLRRSGGEMLSAIQFLTRVPTPPLAYQPDALSRAVKFFPVVGALIGGAAALLHALVVKHLGRLPAALVVVIFLVLLTGGLHEDGLADTADGFGGGHSREKILLILRDSRIGSYGAAALCLSLVARFALISSLPLAQIAQYLIAAHVLCRWTTLPLSYFLPAARESDGQGARLARLTSQSSLIFGTLFSFALTGYLLRWKAVAPVAAVLLITLVSARFYKRKIGGITGDCFGATNQLTEIAVYFCGVWIV